MPPRKPQASKSESKAKPDPTDDVPLQAVVFADSYNSRFDVLCTDTPRILLPLCGLPLLAWTLESLSASKVKQVFVFCGVHADKIEAYIQNSPYNDSLEIQCLRSQTARSAGDALRELDDMHVLNPENPFVLIHSPLISNYDISRMVDAHKKRREEDKNYIMTLGVGCGGRPHPESAIMLVHPPSSRLLHYAPQTLDPRPSRLSLPASLFLDPYPATIDTYEVWSGPSTASSSRSRPHGPRGYRDLGVDVCEADVPALCTENFDWHDLRRHLVNGVLTSELLGKRMAVHLVGAQEGEEADEQGAGTGAGGTYVERIRDTRTFSEVSRDVLRRWAFPLTPDLCESGTMAYELRPGNVYVAADNVVLSRSTTLNGPLLIGPRTALAQNTQVTQSTLGADCSIGPGTVIARSHVFDDVRIGANCHLDQCMVGRGVEIADGVVLGRGVLLGDGVRLEKGVKVPDFMRVGRERYIPPGEEDDPEPETEEEKTERVRIFGSGSTGYIWPSEEEAAVSSDSDSEPEDPDDPFDHPTNRRLLQLGRSLSRLSLGRSEGSLSTLSQASDTPPDSPASSSLSLSASMGLKLDLSLADAPPAAFYTEARDSLQRAYEEEHDVDDALTEFRTLFMGYNAGVARARREVVRFFMEQVEWTGGAGEVLKSAQGVWSRWGGFAAGLAAERVAVVLDAQEWAVSTLPLSPTGVGKGSDHAAQWFGLFLRALYESDTVGEEDLIQWRGMKAARGEEGEEARWKTEEERKGWRETWERGRRYVDALEEMSEDDEEESDEEDEEEGEESE